MFSRKFFGKKYLFDLSIKYLFYSGKFYIFATPMVELAKHIEILLLDNDCVIVPGFGGFMAHHVDAVYDGEEKLFLPPSRTLGFNPQLHINDSLLAQSYVEAYDISYPDAVKRIDAEVSEMRQTINNQGYFELPDIGVIQTNEDGNLEFEPCSAGILTPDLYALTSFEFSEISLLPEKQEETVPTIGIATVATATQTDNAEVVKPVEEPEVAEVEAEYETEEETETVSEETTIEIEITEATDSDIDETVVEETVEAIIEATESDVKEIVEEEVIIATDNEIDNEEIIKEYIYSSLKKLDSNNILKKEDINIEFDTKENFDTNYESNWYYYIL